ncbi:MAG: hypothetical protein CMH54_08350 [Myxococcales bacterium]|nr:hypothetical protein [Myxococcales bacterium]
MRGVWLQRGLVPWFALCLVACGAKQQATQTLHDAVENDAMVEIDSRAIFDVASDEGNAVGDTSRKPEDVSTVLVDQNDSSAEGDVELDVETSVEEPPPIPEGYTLIWEDNFDGPEINTDHWVVASLRDPVTGDLVPGAKGDHLLNYHYAGYITQEDTYIEEGALILRNQKRSYQGQSPEGSFAYTSGWVMSMHRVHLNKGYVEIRAQFPSGDKVWPAMWLISEQLRWCPEWDMWEYFGYREDQSTPYDNMGTHLCYGGWPNQKWSSNFLSSFDEIYDCEAWHIYGFEWTDTEARWFLDGELMHTITVDALGADAALWPNEEMYIVLNNGQGSGAPDVTTSWPNYLKVDFIRLYEKGE